MKQAKELNKLNENTLQLHTVCGEEMGLDDILVGL
jgi:hypothetical protein